MVASIRPLSPAEEMDKVINEKRRCNGMTDQKNAPVVTHCLYCDKEVIVPFCDATDFVCGECEKALSRIFGITDKTIELLDNQSREYKERTQNNE